MQKDTSLATVSSAKKEPVLSLYTDEEIENVSTTSSFAKGDSTVGGQVNFSEVSSTSEETYKPNNSSNKSIFMNLYEEDIFDSGSGNFIGIGTSASGGTGESEKPKPGLMLLGEYVDSGNDTEEEALSLRRAAEEKAKEVAEVSSNKNENSNLEQVSSEVADDESGHFKKSVESGVIDAINEVAPTVSKVPLPVAAKGKESKNADSYSPPPNKNFAKLERSISKEEGQISAESDSSDSERSSLSGKGSKKRKDAKRDKSRKKDRKKKKKKKQKQKHYKDKKESDVTENEEKKERKQIRSRSRESSEKKKSFKRSRSRSRGRSRDRDRDFKRRRHSRSSSRDRMKHPKHSKEQRRRSRSRSISRKHSATNRKKDVKSRSRSPKRSTSPSKRRKERKDRKDRHSPGSRSKKKSPLLRRKKLSSSQSPCRYSEHRRTRSPRKQTRSPVKRRRITPERSPSKRSSFKAEESSKGQNRKGSPSPRRKSSYRTSSASDSLDSGHYTNIPLSKINKPDEPLLDNQEAVQTLAPLPKSEIPASKKQDSIASNLPKANDLEKQYSPAGSPEKTWEDEFDLVFTERMSPRQGTEKSMEDVLFGSEAKTPDLKRSFQGESSSKESKQKESKPTEKKKESHLAKLTGITPTADKENNLSQKLGNESGSANLQSKSTTKADERSMLTLKDVKTDVRVVVSKGNAKLDVEDQTEHREKTESNAEPAQTDSNPADKSLFTQTKLESIPFLDETPFIPTPVRKVGVENPSTKSQLGILGPPPIAKALLPTPTPHRHSWGGSGGVDLTIRGSQVNKTEIEKARTDGFGQSEASKDEGRKNSNASPMDMEMSSPEGDIIDQMNEEFWKQQLSTNKMEVTESQSRPVTLESVVHEQSVIDEPYEPESGFLVGEEFDEDLNSITDPKERRKREKQQEKEKTKVQELIDKLHRQARVEEEVKHALKAYYKHRDISKEEYKSVLRRAVPQVTNSSSAIDPERIRSLVKKYVAKIKGQRVDSL